MGQVTEIEVVLGSMTAIVGIAALISGIAWGLSRWHRRRQLRAMVASRGA